MGFFRVCTAALGALWTVGCGGDAFSAMPGTGAALANQDAAGDSAAADIDSGPSIGTDGAQMEASPLGDAAERSDGGEAATDVGDVQAEPPTAVDGDAQASPDAAPDATHCLSCDASDGTQRCGSISDGCGHLLNCGCDAAHECSSGLCVFKPECDCQNRSFACGRLPDQYSGIATECPIPVFCGSTTGACPSAGELCVAVGYPQGPSTGRVCVSAAQTCNGGDTSCAAHCQIVASPYPNPCAAHSANCRAAYANCDGSQMFDLSTGEACGQEAWMGHYVFCGPG